MRLPSFGPRRSRAWRHGTRRAAARAIGRSHRDRPPDPTRDPVRRLPYDGRVLDERDLHIIAALQEDARATYADVAARVGMSASAVHERVRKLEHGGVIRSYRAVVDPEALGCSSPR